MNGLFVTGALSIPIVNTIETWVYKIISVTFSSDYITHNSNYVRTGNFVVFTTDKRCLQTQQYKS
jgi:hypothetical protein